MKIVKLSQGKCTVVDDDDFEWLSQWKWYAIEVNRRKHGTSVWYAVRHSRKYEPLTLMHREIAKRAGFPDSRYYDHRDGDGLNNQRHNLRPASNAQNLQNKRKSLSSKMTSQFKGVCWDKGARKWLAMIAIGGKQIRLGLFVDEKLAAEAYDTAAREHFGEFARLNLSPTCTP